MADKVNIKTDIVTPLKETFEQKNKDIPESERCPKCHCGRIRIVKKGLAVNGNPYSVLTCSNEKYGCDYRETVFVNLNSTRRSSRQRGMAK